MLMTTVTKYRLIILALSSGLSIFVYWSGLYGPLMLDDKNVFGLMLDASFGQDNIQQYLYSPTGPLGRSVSMATFVANALFSQDVFYWKLVNLIVHILCGILIYFTLDQLIIIKQKEEESNSVISLIPLCIAIIWLLHPLHVSTVLYLVQRMTQLSALFVLSGLLSYLIARRQQISGQSFFWYQALTWGLFFPLGIFSKESALLFPIFILLIELFYIQSQKLSNKSVLVTMLISVASGLVFCFIKSERILGGYARREFSLVERLMTEGRVLVDYLGMLLLPSQRSMGFFHDDYVISKGLLDPWTTLASLIGIFGLLCFAFFIRKKVPLAALGIVFFFSGHLLESTAISLELVFEHRNYLPSLGVFMAVTGLLQYYVKSKAYLGVIFAISSAILILITFTRVDTWSSKTSLDYYINLVHPKSERMASKMATEWSGFGKYDLARKKLLPFDSLGAVIHRLDIDCLEKQKLNDEQLIIDMSQYHVADNYVVRGATDIANAGLDGKCEFTPEVFVNFLDNILLKTVTPRTNRQIVMMYKAHFLWRLERHQEVFETLRSTFKLDVFNPLPLLLTCEWMLDIGEQKQGALVCDEALTVASRNMSQYGDLHQKVKLRLSNLDSN